MARTFKEIAEDARLNEPTQKLGSINVMAMIADLADNLERLEYNTAVQLAMQGLNGYLPMSSPQDLAALQRASITGMLSLLRYEIPEGITT